MIGHVEDVFRGPVGARIGIVGLVVALLLTVAAAVAADAGVIVPTWAAIAAVVVLVVDGLTALVAIAAVLPPPRQWLRRRSTQAGEPPANGSGITSLTAQILDQHDFFADLPPLVRITATVDGRPVDVRIPADEWERQQQLLSGDMLAVYLLVGDDLQRRTTEAADGALLGDLDGWKPIGILTGPSAAGGRIDADTVAAAFARVQASPPWARSIVSPAEAARWRAALADVTPTVAGLTDAVHVPGGLLRFDGPVPEGVADDLRRRFTEAAQRPPMWCGPPAIVTPRDLVQVVAEHAWPLADHGVPLADHLKVGTGALQHLYATTNTPTDVAATSLFGIRVVEDTDLQPCRWRLVDHDGHLIAEGHHHRWLDVTSVEQADRLELCAACPATRTVLRTTDQEIPNP
ncbi:MAG TPA: hypothetical protein VGD67_26785 [Pseudonocardiaceae bacterium]